MKPARREALAIVLRALAWLPLCLAAWYFAAIAIGWLPARIASPVIGSVAGKITHMELERRTVTYALAVEGPYRPGGAELAEVRVEVPAATYTFGIAVFAALALAVRGWRAPARVALGAAVLLVLPAFGIVFDALRVLGSTPQLAGLLGWGAATREAIALGYQVGSLLLPTLAPVIAWFVLFPAAWRSSPPPG